MNKNILYGVIEGQTYLAFWHARAKMSLVLTYRNRLPYIQIQSGLAQNKLHARKWSPMVFHWLFSIQNHKWSCLKVVFEFECRVAQQKWVLKFECRANLFRACTISGNKLLVLYAKQPMENHRGPTPDRNNPIELKG